MTFTEERYETGEGCDGYRQGRMTRVEANRILSFGASSPAALVQNRPFIEVLSFQTISHHTLASPTTAHYQHRHQRGPRHFPVAMQTLHNSCGIVACSRSTLPSRVTLPVDIQAWLLNAVCPMAKSIFPVIPIYPTTLKSILTEPS